MKKAIITALLLSACTQQPSPATGSDEASDNVMKIWKAFESGHIQEMKPYFADTVIYEDASGMRFHGPTELLLAFAQKDIAGLDSMRFDITKWESEKVDGADWIRIWSAERRYQKSGADTILMQENWQVKNGRVVYFNQYLAKLPK
jgi:hypothetical protein